MPRIGPWRGLWLTQMIAQGCDAGLQICYGSKRHAALANDTVSYALALLLQRAALIGKVYAHLTFIIRIAVAGKMACNLHPFKERGQSVGFQMQGAAQLADGLIVIAPE